MREQLGDPKGIVRNGYDRISEAYRGDTFDPGGSWYATALEALDGVLAPGSRVLDLGCGCGVPVARHLARTHRVTGVDLSDRQIERARSLVPEATFVRADMTSVEFPSGTFDAVVSAWAIIHVPIDQQPALFDAVARWLRPGGVLLVTVGSSAWTGTEDDWYGAPMYWSHGDRDFYATALDARGSTIAEEWLIPEGDGAHAAFLARRDRTLTGSVLPGRLGRS
jgi:SAM-dependent methyltransferase